MPQNTPLPPRLDSEPQIWYGRFIAWLQSGPPRSLLAVYNAERDSKGLKGLDGIPSSWREIPAKFDWDKRAADYDKAEAERLNIELAERREAWRRNEENMAYALMAKGREIIDGKPPPKDTEKPRPFDPGKVRAAAYCFEAASTIARKALEMSDKRINLSDLTDAEIMRLLALDAARAKPNDEHTP